MNDEVRVVREGVAVVADILKAAGDNPHVKEAGSNLGQTALTITKAVNNCLLPIAAVNFAFDKARAYFADRFENDLQARTSAIPPDSIVEPPPSIAAPVLQGLAFAHEEPDLKSMYLGLLATAMDGRKAGTSHPAFVEIIKQLSANEAPYLESLLKVAGAVPIARLNMHRGNDTGFITIQTNILRLLSSDGQPSEASPVDAMVDNWVRLGLVEVSYTLSIQDPKAYDWVTAMPDFKRATEEFPAPESMIKIGKGILKRTTFGQQFAIAVELD